MKSTVGIEKVLATRRCLYLFTYFFYFFRALSDCGFKLNKKKISSPPQFGRNFLENHVFLGHTWKQSIHRRTEKIYTRLLAFNMGF